tara:strand:- start:1654 stop:1827 length:174 start_codon:yes stop_codon:yes gene_type:complete
MAKYRVYTKCVDYFVHDVEANDEAEARNKATALFKDGNLGMEIVGDSCIDEVEKIED